MFSAANMERQTDAQQECAKTRLKKQGLFYCKDSLCRRVCCVSLHRRLKKQWIGLARA